MTHPSPLAHRECNYIVFSEIATCKYFEYFVGQYELQSCLFLRPQAAVHN